MKPRLKILRPLIAAPDLRTTIPAAKVASSFYLTPEWRGLMDQIIKERGRRCEKCGLTGCRVFGDHVKEIQDGGATLDKANIMVLCSVCHGKKTFAERARRAAASFQ